MAFCDSQQSQLTKVVVIGAGIVGVSTALWLQRLGLEVILIDQEEPGEGTSFGNAGVLAASSVTPVTAPKMIRKLPRYLFNPNFPLFLIWRYFPTVLPFIIRYLLNANDSDTRRITNGLTLIVRDSLQQHIDLAKGTQAEKWLQQSPYIYAYQSRAHFNEDQYVWSLRREAGFVPEEIEGADVREFIPHFSKKIKCLAVLEDHGFILNPGSYVKDLATTFIASGGKFIKSRVTNLAIEKDRIHAVDTECGRINCSQAVITAGVWSKFLTSKLNLKIPMESERGYHVVYKSPSCQPSHPIMIASGKFVMTPMAMGLRCAGVIEFGGLTAPPAKRCLAFINQQVKSVIPGFSWQDKTEWLGHRPAPCDSLPFIGEIRNSGIFVGFGHHHIGLTSGPKTGRILARLIANESVPINLEPFEPLRFSK